MHTVKYRSFEPRLMPRRTKLEMPGWAGKPEPRRDGSHEHAWHCMPFAEGAQYGIELFYPFDNELRVTKRDGQVVLDGDFGTRSEDRRQLAAVPHLRRELLHLPAAARPEGRGRHGGAHRAASALLHRRRRRRAAGGAGAAAHQLVADDLLRRLQGAARGPHPHLPAGRAVHADPVRAGRAANSSWCRWTRRKRPSAKCAAGASTPAARRLARTRPWTSSTNTVFDGTYRHILRAARAKAKRPAPDEGLLAKFRARRPRACPGP